MLRFAAQVAEQTQKVGARIEAERKMRNWSRPELARQLEGIATGNDVYRWETGKHMPRSDTLDAIATLFGITVADLYAGPVVQSKPSISGNLSDALSEAEPASPAKLEKMLQEVLDQQAELLADVSEVRAFQEGLSPLLERLSRAPGAKRKRSSSS